MKHKKVKLTAIIAGIGVSWIQAQESVPAAGSNASGSGGSVSYSIGQMVYTTNPGTNGSVAQGVQQPFEISVLTGIGQAKEINLMLSAYPNPTAESVKLEIEDGNPEGFGYQLYDINGKLLESKKVVSNKTDIAMSSLLPATYFIKVTKGNEEIKVFKIIKK
ncbi:MAG TPA: hypothetical protein DCQ26_11275 [Marinilabiliales bacterium]|jgi:hypothetical protein|nr:MAG: hypothetical protein A2W95_14820 [Bacteroidetes bacterium GWA2_40_14]OFX71151.1 MAG: hypothetical protein A2W96_15555 [Bacteroidetes bacterium GWD2_40_43]OFX92366.1 MAG: hypothetical protein A2W97_10400 [Bacteroidetes bacterium GWE2_40_63]OFY22968.1 MAG: hypothetical protein A2W88_04385 [Bacteroidetes bacterium GWF2_40_13]OFZ29941.1 MAG: hypothetical protein A2437_00585 [Bacteroidetes bacterium RIFOXYC2_FULL_40_12]HAM99178.1 hypothetical protein [Marinilabiliales bacterium]